MPPKLAKKDKLETLTPQNPEKPPAPQDLLMLSQNCGAIQYNGIIKTPPSNKPFDKFLTLLAASFQIIQDILGKDVSLAAWDKEHMEGFPPLKSPQKIHNPENLLASILAPM
jgi:hypothetical protein